MVFSRDKVIRWSGRSIASKLPSSRGDEKFRKALQRDVSGLIRVSCWLILVDVGWCWLMISSRIYPSLSRSIQFLLGIFGDLKSWSTTGIPFCGKIELRRSWRDWERPSVTRMAGRRFFSEIFKYRLVDKLPLLPFQHDLEPSKNEWILLWSYP